jgi:D-beta-D-heptose 7-phosphate kinase/D-beta-D-heptose 1-phosphate adenosyltransferase
MRGAPTRASLAEAVRRFAGARVLVLGDVMLDRYVSGTAARLSPEAPIPVLRPKARHAVPGGAANVALNVARLGGHAVLVGAVGGDAAAAELRALLGAMAATIDARLVEVPDRPTTCKTRFVAGSHQLLRLDEEDAAPLADADHARLVEAFAHGLADADIVLLSDYAKGVLCDRMLAAVFAQADAAGLAVVVDPKRADFAAYRGATVLTPNEGEARAATGIDPAEDAGAERAARAVLAAIAEEGREAAVLVTRSARGVTLVEGDAPALHLAAEARAVADVSGAGDTLVATLAVALASGAAAGEAAALANVAAGIAVGKAGTAPVSHAELEAALHMQDRVATDGKVVTAAEALAQVAAWRAQGLRVGFTNGCFDLIHPGHVRLLTRARGNCDRLVVGLNTDASVRRLKGPSRPMQGEAARATVMASIQAVDLVVLFDDDTPLDLIAALRPDVLVKGADYRIDQVVGADLVLGYGGRVALVDLEEGHSTTALVRKAGIPAAP